MDPDKVALIKRWPELRRVSDLKSFLGTKLIAPLQNALAGKRKNDPVQLSVEQLESFERLSPTLQTVWSTDENNRLATQDGNFQAQN